MVRRLIMLGCMLLQGCGSENLSFLNPEGPVAAAQRQHFLEIIALVTIVVLPVLILTPLIAWRYRRTNEASRYTPKWSFSRPLEFVLWGVPITIVAVLAVLLWRDTQALDPYSPLQADKPPLHVQVVGLDWKWLFIYPDEGIATVGELAFPADRPLAFELTTGTVMQSFFIPALGSQIYAMAGMVTKLHLAARGPGRFKGENTQFNGKGFHKQKFTAVAMPPGEFAGWVATVRSNGIALDDATSRVLARRSTPETAHASLGTPAMPRNVLYFRDVPADQFASVVTAYRHGLREEDFRRDARR